MLPSSLSDINECSANNGGCSHNCTDTQGSFQCSCRVGYQLTSDTKTCIGMACLHTLLIVSICDLDLQLNKLPHFRDSPFAQCEVYYFTHSDNYHYLLHSRQNFITFFPSKYSSLMWCLVQRFLGKFSWYKNFENWQWLRQYFAAHEAYVHVSPHMAKIM